MYLPGSSWQQRRDYTYDASGTITDGTKPQLLLPQHQSRSLILFTNNSSSIMYLDFGSARATCTLSGSVVSSSFTIVNAGFNFTKPPIVEFFGGGYPQGTFPNAGVNSSYVGGAGPGFPSPPHPARAHTVLTSNAVSSIVLDDPGAGYVIAPMMFIYNSDLDPNGAAIASSTSGYAIFGGGSLLFNGTACPTDPVSIAGTTAAAFTCKFMA